MDTSNIVAIIPAGGRATNTIIRHTNLPDTMLPINGKPVIGYILEDLLLRGIYTAIIALQDSDVYTEQYVTKKFGSRLAITVVRDEGVTRGLGHVIYRTLNHVRDDQRALIYLGDTIYRGPLEFETDFVVTSTSYENSSRWCFVEDDAQTQCFVNKPKEYSGGGSAMAGIYFISDTSTLRQRTAAIDKTRDRYELYEALAAYQKPFAIVPAEGWYDCGNIENYYRAKVDFLKIRSFNSVVYNDLYGSITKTSTNKEKIADEVNWYKNIPHELKIFSPRLIDYRTTEDTAAYSLEYYGYQSLADSFIFNHFDEDIWRLIIDRLLEILGIFSKYTTQIPFASYDEMYRTKTLTRIATLTQELYWKELFQASTITINGTSYLGWPSLVTKLPELVSKLYQQSAMTFMHGDPCLSNILFDPHNRIFKFIDPRGSFGESSVYGDHHYDIAKVRHSFASRYDFIVSDLFEIKCDGTKFTYQTFHESEHEQVAMFFDQALTAAGYDLTCIKAIEGLLFISMLPLHNDAPPRQQAMFATGIQLLNQVLL